MQASVVSKMSFYFKVKTPMDGSVRNWSLDAVEAFRNIALFKDMIVFIEGFDSKGEEYVVSLYQDFEGKVRSLFSPGAFLDATILVFRLCGLRKRLPSGDGTSKHHDIPSKGIQENFHRRPP